MRQIWEKRNGIAFRLYEVCVGCKKAPQAPYHDQCIGCGKTGYEVGRAWEQLCTCADEMCQKNDAPTPAKDLYMMVNMLRTKLHPPALTPLGEACVDPESYIL